MTARRRTISAAHRFRQTAILNHAAQFIKMPCVRRHPDSLRAPFRRCWRVQGEQYSWITGVYWTLTVMTTLGFGDITFTSDTGRAFSIVVLLSGVVFLLVLLPFLFIRLFYAPWLEARIRPSAPRRVPEGTEGHVIIAEFDPIGAAVIERLRAVGIPYFVLDSDPASAAELLSEHVSVIAGENDSTSTYERLEETQLTAETIFPEDGKLLMLGSMQQRQEFVDMFGDTQART
jgi:hypothetical protein